MSGTASSASPGLTDQTSQVSLAFKSFGGACTLSNVATPKSASLLPSSLTIHQATGKLVGRVSCANTPAARGVDANKANAYPPSGSVKIVYNQIDAGTAQPYFTQMYVAVSDWPISGQNATPDVVRLKGVVTKGVGQGRGVTWNLLVDPMNPKTKAFDSVALAACADGTPSNVSITKFLVGDGTSPGGNNATGLKLTPGI
jgi:hypothetical protein